MGMDDDFLLEDEDDEKTIEFIKNYLPQDLKGRFSDDELYYMLDLIVDYYTTSGCLDAQPDEEGYINIDQDEIVNYIVGEAKKDGITRDLVSTLMMSFSLCRAKWNMAIRWAKLSSL